MKNKKDFILKIVLGLGILLTMCFIFGNSIFSKEQSGDMSAGFYYKVQPFFEATLSWLFGKGWFTHQILRKLAHFSEFFVLGLECVIYLIIVKKIKIQWIINALSLGLLIAVSDESLQIITNRGAQVSDILIDFSGFTSALIIVVIIHFICKSIKTRKIKVAQNTNLD